MKKPVQIILFLTLTVVIVVGISACAPKMDAVVTETAVVPEVTITEAIKMTQAATASAEVQATEATSAETTTIDVEALILEKLQNHHSIARVYGAVKTRDEWNTTLDRMIGYGAKISEEEKTIIIDYLLSR